MLVYQEVHPRVTSEKIIFCCLKGRIHHILICCNSVLRCFTHEAKMQDYQNATLSSGHWNCFDVQHSPPNIPPFPLLALALALLAKYIHFLRYWPGRASWLDWQCLGAFACSGIRATASTVSRYWQTWTAISKTRPGIQLYTCPKSASARFGISQQNNTFQRLIHVSQLR